MRYQIRNAKVQFGADTILNSVNFEIHDTEKIAIVGRNGCGKTTLLRLIAGDIEMSNLDSDETCGITMSGKQNIGFLRQINFTDGDVPVKEELEKAFSEVFACEARKKEIEKLLAETEDHKKAAGGVRFSGEENRESARVQLEKRYGNDVPEIWFCARRSGKTDR